MKRLPRQMERPHPVRSLRFILPIIALMFPVLGYATPEEEAAAIPHVKEDARRDYLHYRVSDQHKAFAIAPGGAWSWLAGKVSPEQAGAEAIGGCENHTSQRCTLYALDDEVVFDPNLWAGLWAPYLTSAEAQKRRIGRKVGERFFDIRYRDRGGEERQLSSLRGKVVMVHFWGSWCPPCLREFPSLLKFQQRLDEELGERVELVMLQVREPFTKSLAWVKANGFADLPVADSGVTGEEDTTLDIAGGKSLPDRYLARVFPSSYVLDKNGVVLFSHNGSIKDWVAYLPLFRHVVENAPE